jgi:hypothetical protein
MADEAMRSMVLCGTTHGVVLTKVIVRGPQAENIQGGTPGSLDEIEMVQWFTVNIEERPDRYHTLFLAIEQPRVSIR